jgi:hypothetical protein
MAALWLFLADFPDLRRKKAERGAFCVTSRPVAAKSG